MKVIAICGSPRKGNTEQMLRWVLDACKAGGADVELVKLRELDIKHCNGCNSCYGEDRPCVIDDDMEHVISKLLEADAVVFGSPNYFNNVSGLMKDFIDRTNSIAEPSKLNGKVAGVVSVGARAAEETGAVAGILEGYAKIMDMVSVGSVVAQAEDPGEVSKKENIKLACTDLGNKIADRLGS
ncbi:flavodoxin family protein [Candidatus Woesearchaeota archaeon]|nr:flavodoxin family protein [Candidatus Woesearchaeota archaeon]